MNMSFLLKGFVNRLFSGIVFILVFLSPTELVAQLTIDNTQTATQLAQILAGPNITVTNATLTGANTASGSFVGTSNLGFGSGVILSTGNAVDANGPNNAGNTSTDLGQPGTAVMDSIAGNVATFDALTLQFDFEVQSSSIQFEYIFASEEYPEFAPPNNSGYNDVFAFFISGPGLPLENIALVPGSPNPVTINNINDVTNNQYYFDNTGGATVQYDAFTTVLTAERQNLTPCTTYTLTLVIADAGDGVWDSGVFLKENSLVQGTVGVQTQTVNADSVALEGCIPASFTFGLSDTATVPTVVNFTVGGTAINGIDYQYIDSTITIPAGQISATVFVNSISDGITEGQETVWIIYQPEPCLPPDTAWLFIDDAQPIDFNLDGTDLLCHQDSSGVILANATGGFPPYTYEVTDSLGNTTSFNTSPINNMPAGEYTVQVYDSYGCKAEALVVGGSFNAGQTFLPDGSGVSYTSSLNISGFDQGATLNSMSQLQQICANMEHSYLGDLQIRIISPSGQSVILKEFNGGGSCDLGEPIATAPVDGAASSTLTDPGIGYDYCWNDFPVYGTMVAESNNFTRNYTDGQGNNYTDNYLPQGSYASFEPLSQLLGSTLNGNWTIEVTDQFNLDNGYIFNWNISLLSDLPDTVVVLEEPDANDINGLITQANCGGNDGAINITVTGTHNPFTYQWSNGATTEDLTNIPAGSYTVVVTDTNMCSDSSTFLLNNISSINTSSNVTQVNCPGGNNGAIDLTVSGGTAPYNIAWSNGDNTEDISNLTAGSYTVTITDDNNCSYNESITVSSVPPMSVTLVNLNNEICGNFNGSIDIDVTGGSGSYGYSWSNGATTQDITGLNTGSYTVTVTDGNGCVETMTFNIINDVSNCSSFCFLDITTVQVLDDQCGAGVGSIDVTFDNVTAPYNVTWSNGATTDDISNLTPGSYTVTVNDAAGCSASETIVVGNNTGNLAISNSSTFDEACGNGLGSIDITVSGGTLPYSYNWSNGATTEDISSLSSGTYSVDITDGIGCVLNQSFVINNNTGSMSESASVISDTCNSSIGEIDLTVSGGNAPFTYSWDNGATTEDLTGLSAGTYTCTITDASGCVLVSQTYTINNGSGSLSLDNLSIVNETCSGSDGAIDITISGGTAPINFNWSNGATTEDISGLSAGTYSGTITDDNGCSLSTGTLNVFNSPSNLIVTTNLLTDEICGNGQGVINVDVSGGSGSYTYSWSNGSNSQDLLNVSAGTYTLTVNDGNGCVTTYTETINNTPGTLTNDNIIVTDEICGNGSGAIDIVISGGQAPYTYVWSNGATTQDINGLSAGFYTCDITDQNGCTISISATVNNNASGLSVSHQVTSEVCSNGQGEINLTITGGAAPYSYNWSNGATTEDITGQSAGTFSCQITDNNGCIVNTGNIVITNNASTLSASSNVTDEDCGNGLGEIDLTVVGGSNPITFSWSNGASTEDLTGLSAGTYVCTITDANGCVVTHTATVNNNSSNLSIDDIVITNELCGNASGSIDVTISGGTAPLTYAWSNGATTEDITGLSQGSYTSTITDNNGCQVTTGPLTVANDPGTLSLDNVIAYDEQCGNGLGAIDITVSGGQTPYTYLWNTGATSQDLFSLNLGNYSCTITDANGCTAVANATILNGSSNLSANTTVINEACGNSMGSIDLTPTGGTAPYTFAWSNGATTEDISGLSAGTYTVQIFDDNGCNYTHTETITNAGGNLAISSATVSDEICGNMQGAIDITVGGGTAPLSFIWSNGATTEDLTGLSAGTYDITVTDNNGCSVQASYTVGLNTGDLNIVSIIATDEVCGDGNGSIDLTITNGPPNTCCDYTLNMFDTGNSWNGASVDVLVNSILIGNFTVSGGGANTEIFPVCTGDNVELVFNSGNFDNELSFDLVDGAGTVLFSQGPSPTPGTVYTGAANCPIIPPNVTYSWSNGANTEDINGLNAGSYSVTVTDQFGCTVTGNATVNNNTGGFTASITSVTDESCGNGAGAIDVTTNGGSTPYTFSWDNGATTEDLSGLSAGSYELTITDNAGCSIVLDTVITNISTGIAISNAFVQNENCTDSTGFIDLTMTGGNTPYTFLWSNGETTEDIIGLTSGVYTCVITDNSGCSINYSGTIGNNSTGMMSNSNVTNTICTANNGEIEVTMTAGTGPFTYSWSGGTPINTCCDYTLDMFDTGNSWNGASVDVIVDGTLIGNFTVSGGGANTEIFQVCTGENVQLVFNSGNFDNELSFDLLDGSGTVIFSQGPSPTPGTVYNAAATCPSGGNNTTGITDLAAGSYDLTITDGLGCTVIETYVVGTDNNPALDITTLNVTDEVCDQDNGSINVTATGGTTYMYSLNSGTPQTSGTFNGLTTNTYLVTVTDENGCEVDSTVFLDNIMNNNLAYTAINITDETCTQGNGIIGVAGTGGSSYTYSINGGTPQASSIFTGLSAGTYQMSLIDQNGCQVDSTITLIDTVAFVVTVDSAHDENCGQANGMIDILVSPAGSYTYSWNTGATTEDLSGLSAGTYTITVSGSGCVVTLDTTLINTPAFTTSGTTVDEDCGDGNGSIDLSISGGSGSFTFDWDNGAATEDINGLSAGTYEVIITDAVEGCSDTLSFTINNVSNGMAFTSIVVSDSCLTGTGSIDLTMTGGSGNFSFAWSNSATTEDISGLSVGSYDVTITDNSDGCEITGNFSIGNIGSIILTGNIVDATCATCSDGSIDITVGGSPALPVTYSWDNGATTEDLSGLLPGDYIITATDQEGCSVIDTFTVDFTNGLYDPVTDWTVNLYPNPSKGIFNLDYQLSASELIKVSIVNSIGELIELRTIDNAAGTLNFDLSDKANGIYMIRMEAADGRQITHRLILVKD